MSYVDDLWETGLLYLKYAYICLNCMYFSLDGKIFFDYANVLLLPQKRAKGDQIFLIHTSGTSLSTFSALIKVVCMNRTQIDTLQT